MKIEKAQKHTDKRTVVVGEDSRDRTVGVITEIEEGLTYPVYVTGRVVNTSGAENEDHYTCYREGNVRKATDEEIAAFFEWLRGDGAELCEDNFARLGGAPRGWEDAAPAPSAATVQPYKVGDRVRLRDGRAQRIAPTYFAPGTEVVIEEVVDCSHGFKYQAKGDVMDGGARSQVGLKHADIAGLVTSSNILDASASMDQRRAVVGKRVRIVRSISGMNNGKIGVVAEVDGSSTPYRVEHDGGNSWAKEIEVVADEAAPSKPEEKKAAETVEEIKAGDWVYILSTDCRGAGGIPREVRVGEVRKCLEAEPSDTYLPIAVERFPGAKNEFGSRWHFARAAVRLATAEEIAAEEARRSAAPTRPTVGDSVIGVRVDADRSKNGLALIARIEKDDRDSRPYRLAGGDTFYHADHTFPRTLDGFRAANAKQREYGVEPEDGDYVAIHRRTDYMFGVYHGGYVYNGQPDGRTCVEGYQDWSDRVVVITKRPRV